MYKFHKCKEEELTVTLLAIIFEIVIFGIVSPEVLEINMIVIIITLLLFIISNKNMFKAYLLSRGNGEYRKAKIVKENVICTRGTVFISTIVYIPEFEERYKWREQVKISLFNDPPIDDVLCKFLFTLPEVDIIIDPKKHKRFYVILEPIFNDFYRTYQNYYKIMNYVLLLITIILAIYAYI